MGCPHRIPVPTRSRRQKHERQAQHHFQQQQRRKREEEERQRHAEYQARKEREANRDEAKAEAAGQDPAHDKSQSKGKGSGGSSAHGSDKPKRPSSLLATNNVMKLKQIIPLQGKFLSGGAGAGSTAARSPSPKGFSEGAGGGNLLSVSPARQQNRAGLRITVPVARSCRETRGLHAAAGNLNAVLFSSRQHRGTRREKGSDCLHPVSDLGAGKGISLQ